MGSWQGAPLFNHQMNIPSHVQDPLSSDSESRPKPLLTELEPPVKEPAAELMVYK